MAETATSNRLTTSLFAVLLTFGLALIYVLSRVGFAVQSEPLLKSIPLALFLSCFAPAIRFLWGFLSGRTDTATGDAELLMGAFAIIVFAGAASPIVPFSLMPFFTIFGWLFFVIVLIQWLILKPGRSVFMILLTGSVFAVSLACTVWGLQYFNPLFLENMAIVKTDPVLNIMPVHPDTLFHSSITSMVKLHNIPSTGLDGLPYLSYHYGSHFVFAQFEKLTGLNSLTFNNVSYPVIFVPLFFYSLLLFSTTIQRYVSLNNWGALVGDWVFWLILIVAAIEFIPHEIQASLGILWPRFLYIPSYNLSIIFVFLILSMVLSGLKQQAKIKVHFLTVVQWLAVFPILFNLVGFLKISTLAVAFAGIMLLFLRLEYYRNRLLLASFAVTFVGFVATSALTTGVVTEFAGIAPLFQIFRYTGLENTLLWFVVHFFWSLLFITLLLKLRKWNTLGELKAAVINKRTIEIELVAVVILAGMLPGLVLDVGRATGNFSSLQKWLAIALLLAYYEDLGLSEKLRHTFKRPILRNDVEICRLGAVTGLLLLMLSMVIIALLPVYQYVRSNLATRIHYSSSIRGTGEYTAFINIISGHGRDLLMDNQQYVLDDTNYIFLAALERVGNMPLAEKKNTVVYIPRENTQYWQLLSTDYSSDIACFAIPLLAPSVTGMPMIYGLPDESCQENRYGYSEYTSEQRTESNRHHTREDLCSRALAVGFSRIVVIDLQDNTPLVETVNCVDS